MQPGVGRALCQTIAEHLRHVGVLTVARFLLHKGGKGDKLRQGHSLLFERCVHFGGELCIELGVEGSHIVVHRIVLQKLVGFREEIALALHKAVRGILILRDVLPEGISTEIAFVGFLQKLLGGAQTGGFHLLGDGNGRGALRDGHTHRFCLGVLGKGGNDRVVGNRTGLQDKIAVLQLCGSALLSHIPAEQVGRADDACILELVGDRRYAAALRDAYSHLCAAGCTIAVDLIVGKVHRCTYCQKKQQKHYQQNFACAALFAGCGCIVVCHTHLPFFSFPASDADSFRLRQKALRQSGSCRIPAGCPRPETAAGQRLP